MEELELKDLFRIIFKNKWLIVSLVIICTLLAIASNHYLVTPLYDSKATLMVNGKKGFVIGDLPASIDLNSIGANQKLVVTYGEIIKSRTILSRVIELLNLPLSYEALSSMITAAPVNETEILKINVTYADPEIAAKIANTTADVFIAEVIRIMKVDNVEFIDRAIPKKIPVNVRPLRTIVIFDFFGVLIGIFIAFLLEVLNQKIKTTQELNQYLGIPVWGAIPDCKKIKFKFGNDSKKSGNMLELVVSKNPKSFVSEKYRAIRTHLLYANADKKTKCIIVTSATDGEGKTTTISNLALTLVDANYKVLLLDCDMRKPRIHKIFELDNGLGLSHILMEKVTFEEAKKSALQGKMDVVTAGRSQFNPSELLSSEAMQNFLVECRKNYDYILIDSPPVLLVTDIVAIAKSVDGVLLVCAANKCEVNQIVHAKESIEMVGGKIIGTILNRMPIKDSIFYNNYYYADAQVK